MSVSAARLRRERCDCIDRFNRILKALVQEMGSRAPGDALLARARTQISIGIREVPTRVVETAGPYLYKYRESILAADPRAAERELRANSFQNEFAKTRDGETKDLSVHILQLLHLWWDGRSEEEFAFYYPALQELVRTYIEYLCLQRGVLPPARSRPQLAIFSATARAAVRS